MSQCICFDEADWLRHKNTWEAWWSGELPRPIVVVETVSQPSPSVYEFTSNYPLEMPAEEVVERYSTKLEATRFFGDAWPRWWVNFGPGIVAGFVGARVNSVLDTVWFDPPLDEEWISWADRPLDCIHPQYNPANVWWKRVQDLTHAAVDRWQGAATVCYTDLGGNLDILASLRTTGQLLLDLHDSPEQVRRLCQAISGLWLHYYAELTSTILPAGAGTGPWAAIWSPGTCYMLQSDFSYMISPRMFEEFVLPDLETCCAAMDHPFYHLDGQGQVPHLDMLLGIHNLRGIQWVPGDGSPPHHHWLDLLRRIRRAGKLCQMICTAESALAITRALGGKGFAFQITDTLSDDEAEHLVNRLYVDAYE